MQELQGTARRYITSLLASTSGYQQKLPGGCEAEQAQVEAMDGVDSEQQQQRSRSSSCCSVAPVSATSCSTTRCVHGDVCLQVQHVTVQFRSLCEHHMLPFYGKVHVAYAQPVASSSTLPSVSGSRQVLGQGFAQDAPVGVVSGGDGSLLGLQPVLQPAEVEQVVAVFTQRLQVQERITHQVADAVAQLLQSRTQGTAAGCRRAGPQVAGPQEAGPQEAGPQAGGTLQGGVVVLVDAGHMCMVARGVESHSGSTTSIATRGEALLASPELRCAVLREARRAAMRC